MSWKLDLDVMKTKSIAFENRVLQNIVTEIADMQVKVNDEWKIADKLPAPGFDAILGIIGLIGSVYVIRRYKKLEK